MKRTAGLTFGVSLLMLTLILLVAGCTQPSSTSVSTASPTATAAPMVTTVVTAPQAAVITTPAVNETLKSEMVTLVGTMAKNLDKGNLSIVLKEGENSTAFPSVLRQIREFKATDSRIAYVYVLEQKNGTARFLVDTDHGTVNAAKCGEEYADAPSEMKKSTTVPFAVGPYTDHWGTFISAAAPVDLGSNTSVILVIDSRV
ncbi:MAG: hypothetical protein Q7T80_13280 [Methanoregula sp.]|nr:hypothetical protein [Methanoregula sp.]